MFRFSNVITYSRFTASYAFPCSSGLSEHRTELKIIGWWTVIVWPFGHSTSLGLSLVEVESTTSWLSSTRFDRWVPFFSQWYFTIACLWEPLHGSPLPLFMALSTLNVQVLAPWHPAPWTYLASPDSHWNWTNSFAKSFAFVLSLHHSCLYVFWS